MKKIFRTTLALIFTFALALPMSKANAQQVFFDVYPTQSFYEDIMYLYDNDLIENRVNYGINVIVTREEAAVLIAKAIGLDGTPRATKFRDVPKSNENSGYIQSAVEAGIFSGYPDGTFKPYEELTRGHLAVFIARAFELPAGNTTFKDVPKGHTAYEAVKQLAAANITSGYGDGTFKPSNHLTRAHLSVFVARAIKYQESTITVPKNRIPFTQGEGYEQGAYDITAVQPTVENWTRQSRFNGPEKPEIKWSNNNTVSSEIIVGKDGTLYFANDSMIALSPNGKIKWKTKIGDTTYSHAVIGKDGTIYVAPIVKTIEKNDVCFKENSGLFAINPNGQIKWSLDIPTTVFGAPTLDAKGNIYIGSGCHIEGGRLYAVNPQGKIISTHKNDYFGFEKAANITKSGYVFAQNSFYKNQTLINNPLGGDELGTSSTVGADETIYYGTLTGSIMAMNPDSTVKWELNLNEIAMKYEYFTLLKSSAISATPAISENGTLYTGDRDGNLYSIHLADLQNVPKYETSNSHYFTKNEIRHDSYELEDLISLNQHNWITETGHELKKIVIAKDGTIFAGNRNGMLLAYTPDGKLKWQMKLVEGSSIKALTIGENQTLYVSCDDKLFAIGNKK